MPAADQRRLAAQRRIGALMLAIAIAGTAVIGWSILILAETGPPPRAFFLLSALTLATGFAKFRMPGSTFSFSVSETFTMTAALLVGPAAGTVLVAADAFTMSLRLQRGQRTAARMVYNATAPALAMWIAAHTFAAAASAAARIAPAQPVAVILPLLVFAAVYFVLNTGFIALAVGRELRDAPVRVWRAHFAKLWFTFFLGASVAGLVNLGGGADSSVTTILLVVPLVVVLYATAYGAVERLRERREHLAERELYATALRSTGDGVMLTDPDRRVTYMNPAAERLTGCTVVDARGRGDVDVFRVSDSVSREPNPDPAAGNPAAIAEFILTRADGSESPIEAMHAPILAENGDFRGMVWTFRDVRERKAIEDQRALLLAMEQEAHAAAVAGNRLKDEFLAAVSHELRTPATSILGWARLLRDGRMDEHASQRALAALERSARAQATVLDDLVDTSRMVQGTLRLDVRRTDVMTPLREALETLEPAFRAKNIRVNLAVHAVVPPIDGDPDRLRQVFWNLLANAIKFTKPAGHVDIAVRHEGDHLAIEFTDDGQGIESAFLPYVFDKFRQADGSSTRKHGGLGLGLAIVRYVVESHGGTVEAWSPGPGEGARFTVRLPASVRRRGSDSVELAS
jgi:PAS domain S-box-containing protein